MSYKEQKNLLIGLNQKKFKKTILLLESQNPNNKLPLALNWGGDFFADYKNESILWVNHTEANKRKKYFIPQSVLIAPSNQLTENSISIKLDPENFQARDGQKVEEAFATYSMNKTLFNGQNARLQDWITDQNLLVFQGCYYYDYLKTNLALDMQSGQNTQTLRNKLAIVCENGRLQPLSKSYLANTTGINGLIFSNDGYMILQKRNQNLAIRPGELCSGFSGTIDKSDIQSIIEYPNPKLSDLDVPREMVEELGIHREEVGERHFLGITRELIRGGAPEIFYSLNINLSYHEIKNRIPQEKEGNIHAIKFGDFAKSQLSPQLARDLKIEFWRLIKAIRQPFVDMGDPAIISIPFLTNLVLWYWYCLCKGNLSPEKLVGANPYDEKMNQ